MMALTAENIPKIVALFVALGLASYAWVWLASNIRKEIEETMK